MFSEDKKGNSVFTATADVIVGALNTAIFASKGFTDKFDFETFGKNVARGFNRFSRNSSGNSAQKPLTDGLMVFGKRQKVFLAR